MPRLLLLVTVAALVVSVLGASPSTAQEVVVLDVEAFETTLPEGIPSWEELATAAHGVIDELERLDDQLRADPTLLDSGEWRRAVGWQLYVITMVADLHYHSVMDHWAREMRVYATGILERDGEKLEQGRFGAYHARHYWAAYLLPMGGTLGPAPTPTPRAALALR